MVGVGPAVWAQENEIANPQATPEDDLLAEVRLYWENDSIYNPGSQDRHYTNAYALTFAYQPDWAAAFWDGIGLPADRAAAGFVVGQQMYTPEDIEAEIPDPNDEPYAGYLYGGVYLQRQMNREPGVATLDHVELNVGVVGPSAQADTVQEEVHATFEEAEPRGWDYQLEDEVAVQVFARRKWRIDLLPEDAAVQWQVIPKLGAALGTVRIAAEGEVLTRVGLNLPDDFGPGRIWDLQSATGSFDADGLSVYGFLGAGGRAVAWDTFLDGNVYHDSASVDREPIVGELRAGVTAGYRMEQWAIEASYGITFNTDRFETQDTTDWYATIMLAAIGRF